MSYFTNPRELKNFSEDEYRTAIEILCSIKNRAEQMHDGSPDMIKEERATMNTYISYISCEFGINSPEFNAIEKYVVSVL